MEKVERLVVRKEGDSPAVTDVTDPGTPHRTTDLAHGMQCYPEQLAGALTPCMPDTIPLKHLLLCRGAFLQLTCARWASKGRSVEALLMSM